MLFTPPGTLVPKAFCFSRDVLFFFNQTQDLRAPSADRHETLPRDHYLLGINNPGPKIWGPSPKKFGGQKTCKIWTDFTQLPTLIANISERDKISKIGKTWSRAIPSAFSQNKSGELWSTIHKVVHVSLDPPKSTFSTDYISALVGAGSWNF